MGGSVRPHRHYVNITLYDLEKVSFTPVFHDATTSLVRFVRVVFALEVGVHGRTQHVLMLFVLVRALGVRVGEVIDFFRAV